MAIVEAMPRCLLLKHILVITCLLLYNPFSIVAEVLTPIPGWDSATSGSLKAVAISGEPVIYNSVAVADIDGITDNGKETIVVSSDGLVTAVAANGNILWTHALPNHSCQATSNNNKSYSSPAIGQLFGDGISYVVVGYGGVGGSKCGGGLVAIRGTDGARRWHFNIRRFDKRNRIWAKDYTVFGSPSLTDVNNDGFMEVAFGSFDRGVYLLNARGKVIYRYSAADTSFSSPAFADIDDDGRAELIVATDISQNNYMNPPTPNGGILYALKTGDVRKLKSRSAKASKKKFKHYDFRSSKLVIWRQEFDQVLMSSPVIADVHPSPGKEIVIGSGCYFPEGNSNKRGRWFKVLNLKTGAVLNTLPIEACSPSSAAVGDIDEDGQLEIVVSVNGSETVGGDGNGRLMAFKANNSEPLWSIIPEDRNGNVSFAGHFSSPIIADIDGNGSLEVLLANSASVGVFRGLDGQALTCQARACDSQIHYRTGGVLFSTPTVADINIDGQPELIIGAAIKGKAALFGWTSLQSSILSDAGTHLPYTAPWSTHRGNVHRSGNY